MAPLLHLPTLAALLLAPHAAAQDTEAPAPPERPAYFDPLEPGPAVGEPVPDQALDAIVSTIDGDEFVFDEFLGERWVFVVFYRAHWCGSSMEYIAAWNKLLERTDDLGVSLMAVSYEKPELIEATRNTYNFELPILCDTTGDLTQGMLIQRSIGPHVRRRMQERGEQDLTANHLNGLWHTPGVGAIVIDPDRVVRFVGASWSPRFKPNPFDALNAYYEAIAEEEERQDSQPQDDPDTPPADSPEQSSPAPDSTTPNDPNPPLPGASP